MKQYYNSYIDLIKHKQLAKYTSIMLYLWFYRYFTYFSIAFALDNFGNELGTNLALGFIIIFIINNNFF